VRDLRLKESHIRIKLALESVRWGECTLQGTKTSSKGQMGGRGKKCGKEVGLNNEGKMGRDIGTYKRRWVGSENAMKKKGRDVPGGGKNEKHWFSKQSKRPTETG